jgi:hypothetical protein
MIDVLVGFMLGNLLKRLVSLIELPILAVRWVIIFSARWIWKEVAREIRRN